ncbi:3'-5' RNA nuclease TATDN2-like isoform X4 [Tachypleus tridentatus]|uniref:3'-5' RNA nuclease TATDN2-like isoform X4 n=1 Tax=Tachypleus tridentatus TaxID=6853 RepID=UPI003FCFDD40
MSFQKLFHKLPKLKTDHEQKIPGEYDNKKREEKNLFVVEVPYDHFIHRHCFTGNWNKACMWLNTFPNLYLGLTPLVTDPLAVDIHEVARKTPLVLETDAPYFIPRLAPTEMKWCHPGLVIHVAAQIAELRLLTSLNKILKIVHNNTEDLWNIMFF